MKLVKRKVELRDNTKITTCSYFEAHKIILNNPNASYIIKPFDSDHMVCVIPEDTFPDLVEGTWEVVDYEDIPYAVEKGSSKRFYEYYRDGGSWDPEFYFIDTLCQVEDLIIEMTEERAKPLLPLCIRTEVYEKA